jgi:hypothetical protein
MGFTFGSFKEFGGALGTKFHWDSQEKNKVMNIGRVQFIKLVLDVLQLLTFEMLHCAITRVMKQVTH